MTSVSALGCGPLSFVDATGKQHELPLSLISFGAGQVATYSGADYAANQAVIDALLASAVGQGLLQPAPAQAPIPVMTARAGTPGAAGNAIGLTFSNPAAAAVDVAVDATEVHAGLTITTLADALGTASGPGSQPGLCVLASDPASAQVPVACNVAFAGNGAAWTADIPAASGVAFTLQASDLGANASLTATVGLGAASTFTLTLALRTQAAGVPLADLGALNAAAGGAVIFAPPATGAPANGFVPPADGKVMLAGGIDPRAGVAASASVAGSDAGGAPTFVASATGPGAVGNTIVLAFANPDAAAGTIDATVTTTQAYVHLTPASLVSGLGSSAAGGTMPAMAFVAGAASLPADGAGASTPFTKSDAGPFTASLPGPGGAPAFVLESTLAADADAALLTAAVRDVDPATSTFTLTLAWRKSVAAVPLKDLSALQAAFGAFVAFAPAGAPPAAGFVPPAAATVTLAGGRDAIAAVAASAVLKSA